MLKDVDEIKRLLLDKEEQVARNLVEKLLTYGTGRILTAHDRGEVERIVEGAKKNQFRVRDLIHYVAESRIFLDQ